MPRRDDLPLRSPERNETAYDRLSRAVGPTVEAREILHEQRVEAPNLVRITRGVEGMMRWMRESWRRPGPQD